MKTVRRIFSASELGLSAMTLNLQYDQAVPIPLNDAYGVIFHFRLTNTTEEMIISGLLKYRSAGETDWSSVSTSSISSGSHTISRVSFSITTETTGTQGWMWCPFDVGKPIPDGEIMLATVRTSEAMAETDVLSIFAEVFSRGR